MTGDALAAAAERLVGAPFRLHGRDPAIGLDCVGVVAAALAACGCTAALPRAYGLRNRSIPQPGQIAADVGLAAASGPVRAGDIVLVRPGPAQHHLLIAVGGDRFVHAHAGLRRVVIQPGPLPWPIQSRWRVAS